MKPTRRQVAQGTAWSAPIVIMGAPGARAAASVAAVCLPPRVTIGAPVAGSSTNQAVSTWWQVRVENTGLNCSIQVTQVAATFTIMSAPTNATTWAVHLGGNGDPDPMTPYGLPPHRVTMPSPFSVGSSLSVSRAEAYTQFWVAPGSASVSELSSTSIWYSANTSTPLQGTGKVAVSYTLSGVYQDGTAWGPITISSNNGGAGF